MIKKKYQPQEAKSAVSSLSNIKDSGFYRSSDSRKPTKIGKRNFPLQKYFLIRSNKNFLPNCKKDEFTRDATLMFVPPYFSVWEIRLSKHTQFADLQTDMIRYVPTATLPLNRPHLNAFLASNCLPNAHCNAETHMQSSTNVTHLTCV